MLRFYLLCILAWICCYAQDYCSLSTDHTMCRFGEEIGRACGIDSKGGVTGSEIEEILRAHNDYRSRIATGQEILGSPGPQPSASNMRALVWDNELAAVAQRWADQCTFQHDKCRSDPRFAVGQSIYWSSGRPSANWTRAVQAWYDEVVHFNASAFTSFAFDYNTAHYTQLVWADTWRVGCGRRSYGGSYRPRGGKPLEYVLSEATPAENVTDEKDQLKLGFFGQVAQELENGDRKEVLAKQRPGFFGGGGFDLNGSQGAVTKSHDKKKPGSRPVPVGGQAPKHPIYYGPNHFWKIPSGPYPMFGPGLGGVRASTYGRYAPSYPFGQSESEQFEDDFKNPVGDFDDSSEESDEELLDPNQLSGISPRAVKIRTYTRNGWTSRTYELSREQLLICNYGPGGNRHGEQVYEAGEACSSCPEGTSCHNGLCAAREFGLGTN